MQHTQNLVKKNNFVGGSQTAKFLPPASHYTYGV
jgi:hypothetical protein